MSNLSVHDWSEVTVKQLRLIENECDDDDLFCVGYLIPLVELVEVENADGVASQEQWQERYVAFVENCLVLDSMQQKDATRIRELVASLTAN